MKKNKCIIVFNTEKKQAIDFLEDLKTFLNENKIQFYIYEYNQTPGKNGVELYPEFDIEKETENTDFIISVGGDGTLLFTSRMFSKYNKPIVGVNVGKLGFTTELTKDELINELKNFLAGNYSIDKRMMLEAKVYREGKIVKKFVALNDIVLGKNSLSRISTLKMHINDSYLCTYQADGLIVSTPTGSTAYNLSAMGPILHPSIHAIILSPICNHSLRVRPLVISDTEKIRVQLLSEYLDERLVADGQEWMVLEYGDEIEIYKSKYFAHILKSSKREFYDVLKNKLHWID